ncbi:MAG: L-rhamnose isomerase, partial [Chloroflexi bacterium]|nr:L-rhamnose isomerase [Chloroflexota bacterium]
MSGQSPVQAVASAAGVDLEQVRNALLTQRVETPSWAFGNSGTRFAVFSQAGVPRTPFEKLEDAAIVHRLTGICPSVAIHIPWDKVDDYGALRQTAAGLGLRIGAINPNVFQDPDYKLGSICHHDATVRRKATDHLLECVEIAKATGSNLISLWFADGTNYPGQGNFRQRKRWMVECLRELYQALTPDMRMLVEYKFYEPGFYHTDLSDWGVASLVCRELGPQAKVLVDLGHHAQGVNVEHIVALLLEERLLGGFHFNNRKYGDDDLIVGAINPYELFLIFTELVLEEQIGGGRDIAYMLDQSHNIEPKIPALIVSVLNVQHAYAKALLVNREELQQMQACGDIIGAMQVLQRAYDTDVRELCADVREQLGGARDPLGAYAASGYAEKIALPL